MNYRLNQKNSPCHTDINPYKDLYIYYLKGRLNPTDEMLPDDFIGKWEEDEYSFLFFSSPANRHIKSLLRSQPQLQFIDRFQMSYDQWLGESFRSFEHNGFIVTPPWETSTTHVETRADKLQILLDPGLVFGTGTHPTTRDCLEALEFAYRVKTPETVLDLGTGTGLLALAAARLGGKRLVAVDLNLLAAKTARTNVCLNRLENQVMVVQGKAEDAVNLPADLVVANLHYDVMQNIVGSEGFLTKKQFILSGLLHSEADKIIKALANYPLRIERQWAHDGIWRTLYAEKD
ncbi:MAG: 50S ribosomal protein L11 methyltransferase [Desulfobacterales bacterium]|jgi:ribosomal protein L11 methyltransferase